MTCLALTQGSVFASATLALENGCFSCHGAQLRGEAHSFAHMATKLSRLKGNAIAQAEFADKYRSGQPLERIHAHERLSANTAQLLVHWLAEGAH